ncbi:MAG: HEAT repeat domain-containing protein, partial [Planctomycetota bacterium]
MVLEELNRIVATSPCHEFRARAIEGIEALNRDPRPTLVNALNDPNPEVRSAAAAALERLGIVEKELYRFMEGFKEEIQVFLVKAGRAGVIGPFISALKTAMGGGLKRTVRLVAHISNRRIIPDLMELLSTADEWMLKSRLIPALAKLKAAEAVPLIIEQLAESHHWVRKEASDALVKLLSSDTALREKTLPLLYETLNHENPWARTEAIRLLTSLKDRSRINDLIGLLGDPQTRVRLEAIQGLAQLNAAEAEDALIAMLKDPRDEVCGQAASTLAHFKSRKSLSVLFRQFESASPWLRLAILETVHDIDPTELEPLIRILYTANKDNLAVVRRLKEAASLEPTTILMTLARYGETDIRLQAIRSLYELKVPATENFLTAMLKDESAEIRAATVDSIALIQNPRTAKLLSGMRNDPDPEVRSRVILALGLLKDSEMLPYLRNALDDPDPGIRAHALLAILHYDELRFHDLFRNDPKDVKTISLLKNMITDTKDPLVSALVERIPASRNAELKG